MASAKGREKALIVSWLVASAVLTVTHFWYPDGPLGDEFYLTVAAGAVTVAWIGTARLRGRARLMGALFAAAITVSSLSDLTSFAIGWQVGAEPDASVADLGWLASYLLLGGGLLVLLRRGDRAQRRDIDGLIDVAAIFVAGMVAIWALAVAATMTDPALPVAVRTLWGTYPVLDLAILVLALRLLLRDRTVLAFLVAAGMGLWLAADLAYLAIANPASYYALLDSAWLWGMILIALALLRGPADRLRPVPASQPSAADEPTLGRVVIALAPLLVPGLVELQWYLRGQDPVPAVTIPATVLLVGLAFLRVARLASLARHARKALASQQRYASALAANSSDAVVVVDADLRLVEADLRLLDGAQTVQNLPGDRGRGNSDLLSLIAAEDREGARAAVLRSLASPGQVFNFAVRLAEAHGGGVWFAARVVNLLTDPDVRGIVINLHDISDQKRAEEELSHQAFHDALTGLANRALLRDRLSHALERRQRAGRRPAVIFVDLDGFKAINDRLGHDRGDEVLCQVADRLTATVGHGETVGRLGGDEFAVLIEQSEQPLVEATATAERMLRVLREPVRQGDECVTVTASAGIAVGDRFSNATDLIRDADVAMYRSKASGKDQWTVYRPGMRTAARERLELAEALQAGLEGDEFRLVYQPVVDLASKRVVGFEALARWQHPDRGLLSPEEFVPAAEETGLIAPLGRWVLHEAVRTAAGWHRATPLDSRPTIAVNLSAHQLADPGLVDDVAGTVAGEGLDPDALVVEVTETALVRDTTTAGARLQRLHRLGVHLAIDDFGTGYSALSYLRHFPVDILKIDRSFVQSVPAQGEFPPLLRGLLEFARTLRFRTLAEGVEYGFQAARLRDHGCELAQGHLFGRPMPADQARRLVSTTPERVGG